MHIFRLRFAVWLFAAWAVVFLGAAQAASWTAAGKMPGLRHDHTATLLPNGKVLVTGGQSNSSTASAVLYDPAIDAWNPAGSLPQARYSHTATQLPNGKILIAGGYTSSSLASAGLYDPATSTWTATAAMPLGRVNHAAALLPNGKVLVTGGNGSDGRILASAVLYDPAIGTWSPTGSMPEIRYAHTATRLPNGKILVTGGHNGNAALANAALYDLTTNLWTPISPMPEPRWDHTATLLPNGKVLITGGDGGDNSSGRSTLASAVLYDPATDTWTPTSGMLEARSGHTATLLPNGKVLVAGGRYFSGSGTPQPLATAELYTPDISHSDLTVTAIALSPAAPAANVAFTAKVTVKNQGATATDGGKLLVWVNQSAAPACSTAATQSLAVGTLAAGASKTLTLAGLKVATEGVKTFRAFVDGHCATAETNESNNQRTLRYRAYGTLPDFTVSAITLNPASPTANTAFTATVTVKNQGTAAGDAGYLDIWTNQSAAQSCGAVGDAWAAIGPLTPGATKTVTLNLLADTPGTKTLRAFANSWCGLGESNQTNNQLGKSYTVQ